MDNLGWRKKARAVLLLGSELMIVVAILPGIALAQHLQSFSFRGLNGAYPLGSLAVDAQGNLYGATSTGGLPNCPNGSGCGVVFEFTPPSAQGGSWIEATLYSFTDSPDGAIPNGGLVIDSAGNLYGTTQFGGAMSAGVVFELSPPSKPGGTWTESVIHTFEATTPDGSDPMAGLIIDQAGNLYGTTSSGGSGSGQFGTGMVFELSPPPQPGGAWTETILFSFGDFQGDGSDPYAPVIFDSAGNLYGTTMVGGEFGPGTVYELSPPSQPGGAWTENILHSFGSSRGDGFGPVAGLTIAPSGALLGTTPQGGRNYGVIFALSPPAAPGGTWQYGLPYTFTDGSDGGVPFTTLALRAGRFPVLYGTTARGGVSSQGVVFELTPPSGSIGWVETPLYSFSGGSDGGRPMSGVLPYKGALYGTAEFGGTNQNCFNGCGTAYRLNQ